MDVPLTIDWGVNNLFDIMKDDWCTDQLDYKQN